MDYREWHWAWDVLGNREWRKLHKKLSDLLLLTIHQHFRHLVNIQFGHLFICSDLTHPEVSTNVSPVPFCLLVCRYLVLSIIHYMQSVYMLQPISSAFLHFVPTRAIFNFFQYASLFYKPTFLGC